MVVAFVVESAAEEVGTTEKDTAKWKEKQARINSNLSIGGGGRSKLDGRINSILNSGRRNK